MSNQSESLHLQPAESAFPAAPAEFEREIAAHLVEALNLDVGADEINPEDPLYDGPLGLDSIDILEIALTISKKYGLQLRADDENNHKIFASLRTLAGYVQANRQA